MSEPGPGTFRDPELPFADRLADLLGRLTLVEKLGLLHQYQAAVPRLGIAPFRTGTEALHGLAWLGPATVFPQAVGLASTWNPDLVRAVGAAVGDETRGLHHKDPTGAGLNVWAPVVNLLRDPRWGRGEEGYAEDPLLTGVLGVAYASGLRGDHPRYLRTAPTLKHFLAYNNETRRDRTSSGMPPRVLHEYELPAFRAPIAAGAAVAVMASYNLVNGRPAHLSPLINAEVRRWTADDVLVVSDAMAPSNVVNVQGYHPDHATSYAALVRAGLDSFTDGDDRPAETIQRLAEALRRGLLSESDVDTAARHVLAIRFRLGEFDPAEDNPYAAVTEEVVNCPAHQALARSAAWQSIVLLSNRPLSDWPLAGGDCLLPLDVAGVRRVAVVGPVADNLYEDWYSGTLPYAVTVRQGVAERLGRGASVAFAEGVDRVWLRVAGDGSYLVAADAPAGAPLWTEPAPATGPEAVVDGALFDIFDWGHGVCALRAVANRRYLTADESGTLANAAAEPGGWVVRETFTLVPRGDGTCVLRHLASGRYVALDHEGTPRADATGPDDATGLVVGPVVCGVEAAVAAAHDADVAVVVVGNHPLINGRETEDRTDLALPPAQERLVRAVSGANPRTVLVVTSSYPYAIGWAQEHVPAILWSAHGGQEYGHALAEVLFGDAAPAGRLTQTWYRSAVDLPDLLDYDVIGADATYLYFRGTPLYPFGHGLTYADFGYGDLALSADVVAPDGSVTVSVRVRNVGDRDSDEVVQLYTRHRRSRVKQPLRQLRGFRRIHLPAGGETTVEFVLAAADLAYWDVTRDRFVVEAGCYDILVGRSSMDIRAVTTLTVHGEHVPPRDPYRLTGAVNADAWADVDLVDVTKDDGDAVLATVGGAWLAFSDVEFGAGPVRCQARMSHVDEGTATLRLRLDDPLDGPVVGTLAAECTGGRYAWAEAVAPVRGASGRHDLYVVLESAGACLRDIAFESGAFESGAFESGAFESGAFESGAFESGAA